MNQSFAQSLAVADNVPARRAGLDLIGLNLGRFTSDRGASMKQAEGRELLLKSTHLQRYVAQDLRQVQVHRHDPAGHLLLPHELRAAARRDAALGGHLPTPHLRPAPLQPQQQPHRGREGADGHGLEQAPLQGVPSAHLGFHLAMLEQVLVRARERGLHPVLLELPAEPRPHRRPLRLRRQPVPGAGRAPSPTEYDVPYVDFNDELDIPNELLPRPLSPGGTGAGRLAVRARAAAGGPVPGPAPRGGPSDGRLPPRVPQPQPAGAARRRPAARAGAARLPVAVHQRGVDGGAARPRPAQPRGLVHLRLVDGGPGAARAAGHARPLPARRLERARVDRRRRRARRRDRRRSADLASPPTISARSTRTSPRAWPWWTACRTRRPGFSSA